MTGAWLAWTTMMAAYVTATPTTDSAIEYCRDMQPQRSLDLEQERGADYRLPAPASALAIVLLPPRSYILGKP
ncbi:hypothetical protein J6590_045646 [Homalodisca vitripennis]|nr:hypothetical protein J6590_045646 [Homalodisca vitripennis]